VNVDLSLFATRGVPTRDREFVSNVESERWPTRTLTSANPRGEESSRTLPHSRVERSRQRPREYHSVTPHASSNESLRSIDDEVSGSPSGRQGRTIKTRNENNTAVEAETATLFGVGNSLKHHSFEDLEERSRSKVRGKEARTEFKILNKHLSPTSLDTPKRRLGALHRATRCHHG